MKKSWNFAFSINKSFFSISFTQRLKHSRQFNPLPLTTKPFNRGHFSSINSYPRDMFSCNSNKIRSVNFRPKSPSYSKYLRIFTAPWGERESRMNYTQLTRAFHFHSFTSDSITYRFHLITTINKLVGLSHSLSIVKGMRGILNTFIVFSPSPSNTLSFQILSDKADVTRQKTTCECGRLRNR